MRKVEVALHLLECGAEPISGARWKRTVVREEGKEWQDFTNLAGGKNVFNVVGMY